MFSLPANKESGMFEFFDCNPKFSKFSMCTPKFSIRALSSSSTDFLIGRNLIDDASGHGAGLGLRLSRLELVSSCVMLKKAVVSTAGSGWDAVASARESCYRNCTHNRNHSLHLAPGFALHHVCVLINSSLERVISVNANSASSQMRRT